MLSQTGRKMLLWVSTLVIVPLGAVSLLNYYQARQVITAQIFTSFNIIIDSLRTKVDTHLQGKKDFTLGIAASPHLRELLADSRLNRGGTRSEIRRFLMHDKVPLDPDIFDVIVLDRSGNFLASTRSDAAALVHADYFASGSLGLALKSVERRDRERVFSVSVPVSDRHTQRLLGVVTVLFRASSIDLLLRSEAERLWGELNVGRDFEDRGRIFVVDNDKSVIMSSSESLLGRIIEIEPIDIAFGSKSEKIGEFTGIFGRDRLGASIIFRDPGWVLILSISKDVVFSPVREFMLIALLRVCLGLVLVLVLTLLIAKNIANPIKSMAETAKDIAGGHWDRRVIVREKKGEISLLANAFNDMVTNLQRLFRELKHSEHFSGKILDTIPSGLAVIDRHGTIVSHNRRFAEIVGDRGRESAERTVGEILFALGGTTELSEKLMTAAALKQSFRDRIVIMSPDGLPASTLDLRLDGIDDEDESILVVNEINTEGFRNEPV